MTGDLAAIALRMFLASLATFCEVLVAGFLFAARQPRRRHLALRATLGGCVAMLILMSFILVATWILTSALSEGLATYDPSLPLAVSGTASMPSALLICAFYLAATVAILMGCFRVSIWCALFCGTAGYALQNLASSLGETMDLVFAFDASLAMLVTPLCCLAVYSIAWHFWIRDLDPSGVGGVRSPVLLAMTAVVVFAVIGFDLLLKSGTVQTSLAAMLSIRLFHCLICLFTPIIEVEMAISQQLRAEKAATERLLAQSERQYQLSRDTIDAINIKCHDLRHQIRHLADGSAGVVDKTALADVAREVAVYDSQVKTGNDALDTILTEKSLLCERDSVTLTSVADGAALSFVAPADLYAFFGNALDNALEATRAVDDARRRSISLIVCRRAGMVSVHVENFYNPKVSAKAFRDGLPQTSKADRANHGFGTRSMRQIAEKYDGTLTMTANGTTFSLDALLPVPAASACPSPHRDA